MHAQTDTPNLQTRNWPAYNEALKRRAPLTIWFDSEMTWDAAPTGRRGRQHTCSDTAIQTRLTMKVLFGVALRQTTGFVESLLRLVGLDRVVPDFSALSRRQGEQHGGMLHCLSGEVGSKRNSGRKFSRPATGRENDALSKVEDRPALFQIGAPGATHGSTRPGRGDD
jgi:hypothetical protein